ncbi:heavy-metal-associated domain-containing protein [Staphylococcus sp. ACRSN]|uniref:heavy-metal-associated domain-containing protein n=1 Tax=Staphylococcus sp. ACRSN TaxID=2918214 RepID=UPI001EF2F6F2|nr:heavy metal-associated domain-containing protein [Staphylococcus sp. ACRSN]MCG7340031.1 heavy-metal-associated domain-containing protein [Staphylococcus sp. ACRSN]
MQKQVITVADLKDDASIIKLKQYLNNIDGVKSIEINKSESTIILDFETPASLNNLEKAVYDLGFIIM